MIENKEIIDNSNKSLKFKVIRPGGNDTALVEGIIDPSQRENINDTLMKLYPNVEQVGFVDLKSPTPQLMMAGGEFCGNATRSTAWQFLNGQQGEVQLSVSGVNKPLNAGVDENGEAYAQMPIYQDPSNITDIGDNTYIVRMEGITHYITFDTSQIDGLNPEEIKTKAMETLKSQQLDREPAAGVIYTQKDEKGLTITPVVYVRDIDTLFLETACGSGTTALGQVLSLQQGTSIIDEPIMQPTGLPIKVTVIFDGQEFKEVMIRGPVVPLIEATLEITSDAVYAIEQVKRNQDLDLFISEGNLGQLYKEIFSGPPYFEEFSMEEVLSIFNNYVNFGELFIARNIDKVIGFSAVVPLVIQKDVAEIAQGFCIRPEEWMYFADLGVEEESRRKKIGKKLVQRTLESLRSGKNIILRTAKENIPAQNLYSQLGFIRLKNMTQIVPQTRVDGKPQDDMRIFMVKQL